MDANELEEISLFEELNAEDQFLNKLSLLDGFKLSDYSTQFTFEDISKNILVDTILSKPKKPLNNEGFLGYKRNGPLRKDSARFLCVSFL